MRSSLARHAVDETPRDPEPYFRRLAHCHNALVILLDDPRLDGFERQFALNLRRKLYGESASA